MIEDAAERARTERNLFEPEASYEHRPQPIPPRRPPSG